MNKKIENIDPSGKREIYYLLLGFFTALISVYLDSIQFLEVDINWFQRSGSLLVILGVISESKYIAKTIREFYQVSGPITKLHKLSMHSGFIMALIGTFIWGYGDFVNKFL